MEQRSLKRSREDSESREASSRGQSESQERLQRMRRENRLPMQDTGPSQKINDRLGKTALEFLTSEERKNLNSGLHKDTYQRDMKESLAIELFRISVKSKHNNNSDLFIESLLREIRKNNLYKQAYGSEESRPHQQVNREELNTREVHNKADQHGSLILLEQIKRGLATLTRQFEVTYQASPTSHPDRLELSIDDFELCSMELRKPHSNLHIEMALCKMREENRYKEIYGNEWETCRSDQEPSKRTWTTQQLHRLVDEMVQIKDFDYTTFQASLSKESKAICEQLKYGRSFNDQEWEDIKTRFQNHNILNEDKRRSYLRYRTRSRRNLQKQCEIRADSKAREEGFKNRRERYSKKWRLNDAPEPS